MSATWPTYTFLTPPPQKRTTSTIPVPRPSRRRLFANRRAGFRVQRRRHQLPSPEANVNETSCRRWRRSRRSCKQSSRRLAPRPSRRGGPSPGRRCSSTRRRPPISTSAPSCPSPSLVLTTPSVRSFPGCCYFAFLEQLNIFLNIILVESLFANPSVLKS